VWSGVAGRGSALTAFGSWGYKSEEDARETDMRVFEQQARALAVSPHQATLDDLTAAQEDVRSLLDQTKGPFSQRAADLAAGAEMATSALSAPL